MSVEQKQNDSIGKAMALLDLIDKVMSECPRCATRYVDLKRRYRLE
jgi:hypothetical protein